MRARAYYAATGTGTKRSAKRAVSATAKGKKIRAESRAKAVGARAGVAGRSKSRAVTKPVVTGKQLRRKAERVDARIRRNLDRLGQQISNAQKPILDAQLSGRSLSKAARAAVKKALGKAKKSSETAVRAAEYRGLLVFGTSAWAKERRRRPSRVKLEEMLKRVTDRKNGLPAFASDRKNRNTSLVTTRAIGEIKWMMAHGGERRSSHVSRPLRRAVPRPASEREAARLLLRSRRRR